ncbi:MAG: hypothetical protein QXM86_04665 [Candidatus Bathyarchaeia archaeon]
MPNYITVNLGVNSVELRVLYAVMNIVAALTRFIAGMVTDKYDHRKLWLSSG